MKNWLTAGTGQTFRRWSLRIIGWGLGIPAGWWIVSTSYRLQQSFFVRQHCFHNTASARY